MKKMFLILIGLMLFIVGCRQDDVFDESYQNSHETKDLNGKTFILTQTELEAKYQGPLKAILNNSLNSKEGGMLKTNAEGEENYGVYIDLNHIQVFESDQLHAITYYVKLNTDEVNDDEADIKELYNLMYISKDYKNYYAILYRYNFNEIPFSEIINNPELIINTLGFVPLNEIENIYENIKYSVNSINFNIASANSVKNAYSYTEFIILSDCVKTVTVDGQPCQGSGFPKHEYGDNNCSMTGNKRATPGYSYLDFSNCLGGGSSGGGGSIGLPGTGGGGPGASDPGTGGGDNGDGISLPLPNKSGIFTKFKDIIDFGSLIGQPNVGNINNNVKTLKAISNSNEIIDDLKDFNSKLSQHNEVGKAYKFKTVNGSYVYDPPGFNLPNVVGNKNKIDASRVSLAFCGIIHTHPILIGSYSHQGTPMFSTADLLAIFKLANEAPIAPNRKPSEAFVGIVNDYGLYLVMLPNDVTKANIDKKYADFTKKSLIGNKTVGDEDKPKWEAMEKELTKKYQKIESTSDSKDIKKKAHEKTLLDVMKKYGLDMNLYFLPKNGGTFNDKWQQVTLKSNGQVEYIIIN